MHHEGQWLRETGERPDADKYPVMLEKAGAGLLYWCLIPTPSRSQKTIRAILCVNFLAAFLLIIPATHRLFDRMLRASDRIGLEEVIGGAMPLWIIVSTIFATVLLIWVAIRKLRGTISIESLALEWVLLLAWWITLLVILAYGYALGMGG